jgi:DNA-binding beta-propeller fold protein YncE
VTPISIATNTALKPIKVTSTGITSVSGSGVDAIAITPDGKLAYAVTNPGAPGSVLGEVTPIITATNTALTPIKVGKGPSVIAITPDGKTAYVVSYDRGTVTAIRIATSTELKPIKVGEDSNAIAITP